jgi:enoyl-CoA hydratase/carnithine racemase
MAFCRVERDGHLLVVTIDRPEVRNALHRAATDEMDAIWTEFEHDDELRVAILTGSGDRAFCAGYDMSGAEAAADGTRGAGYLARRHPRGLGGLTLREGMTKPLIAAVNGFALGGGLELALACDVVVAAEHAEVGFPEPRVGRMALEGGMHRLARIVPLKIAMGMLLTGRRISAQEAYRIGLVNEVVPAAELMTRSEAILKQIFSNAPLAVKFSLEAVNKGLETSQAEGLSLEASFFGLCAGTDDKNEGTQAFLQKRAPQFQGR